jgi:hypothetical protein
VRLTQPMVNSLALPPGKADAIYFDSDVPGLGLRVGFAVPQSLLKSGCRTMPSAALTVRRIWTFLSPYQSHHSDDGRNHAAKQHPYGLVGR